MEAGLKRLDDLRERRPELAEAVAFYRSALPLLAAAQQQALPFTLEPAAAEQKLAAGRPLLIDEELPLDGETAVDLFLRLCQAVETMAASGRAGWSLFKWDKTDTSPASQAARQIRQAVAQRRLDLADVWAALAVGERGWVRETAVALELDADMLWMLAQNSLKPALRAWAHGLSQVVNLNHWRRGHCPMCGSAPALSEIQGKEGERRLRCLLCGAGWYYPRLQCAFCGHRDHKSLGYIAVEGEEEKYRLQTCDACRRYLKVVVTYDPIPADLLLVEDLATLHLDHIAQERDFTHP